MSELTEAGLRKYEEERMGMKEAAETEQGYSGEIEKGIELLRRELAIMEENIDRVIEKTRPVAAMERPIPDTGEDSPVSAPDTELGRMLADLTGHIHYLSNRLNEHVYRLET